MVGYGDFLRRTSADHGVSSLTIDYDALKALVDSTIAAQRRRAGCPRVPGYSRRTAPAERHSDAASASSREADSLGHDDSVSEESGSDKDGASVMTSPPPPPATLAFVEKLDRELQRIDDVVSAKLVAALRRAHVVVETARTIRGRHLAVEHAIMLTQLVSVFDDVVLLIWFMHLNAIGVSKIVKKFNKHAEEGERYSVHADRWIFMSSGLQRAQHAKAQLEREYAASTHPRGEAELAGAPSSLLQGSEQVRALTVDVERLIDENRHHLCTDLGAWAVDPRIDSALPLRTPLAPGAGDPREAAPSRRLRRVSRVLLADPELRRRYAPQRLLGSGAYGLVSLATDLDTLEPVALKTVRDAWTHPVMAQRAYRETLILRQLRHPHIVTPVGVHADRNNRDLHIVLEYVPHTLEALLAAQRLAPAHKQWFTAQLLDAVAYMHARGVVHRDLKPSNLLVDDRPQLFVADFGLARCVTDDARPSHAADNPDYVQTQWYRAPEVLQCSADPAVPADCWSVGCVLAEMLTGVPLFPGLDQQHQLELIHACLGGAAAPRCAPRPAGSSRAARQQGAHRALRPAALPAARRGLEDLLVCCWRAGRQPEGAADYDVPLVSDLLGRLLRLDPQQRVGAAAALQHGWLRGLPYRASHARGAAEGAVQLSLRCERLYSGADYRKGVQAVITGEAAYDAAVTVQRWWRWCSRGRRGPPPTRAGSRGAQGRAPRGADPGSAARVEAGCGWQQCAIM
eukprot:TRINITY_DN7763_c1_g1_i2.p1 TRINITY_DN7763_c1_g1~~TRINITY_DN7763_c1_g1_i2.p1  ORF type:complete len:741 (+),score=188.42 TRINITY_DN7763_c1_g1_i2:113-2335(+)